MTDEQLKAAPAELLHIPTVLGAVVATYNLPGVPEAQASPADVLAGHLPRQDHQVERPGDRRGSTPASTLPDQPIVVVHRSDGSGTTYIFTDYLSKVSPEWEEKVGARHVRELAGRARRQGQRGRRRAW